jgi:hypothetical protein
LHPSSSQARQRQSTALKGGCEGVRKGSSEDAHKERAGLEVRKRRCMKQETGEAAEGGKRHVHYLTYHTAYPPVTDMDRILGYRATEDTRPAGGLAINASDCCWINTFWRLPPKSHGFAFRRPGGGQEWAVTSRTSVGGPSMRAKEVCTPSMLKRELLRRMQAAPLMIGHVDTPDIRCVAAWSQASP